MLTGLYLQLLALLWMQTQALIPLDKTKNCSKFLAELQVCVLNTVDEQTLPILTFLFDVFSIIHPSEALPLNCFASFLHITSPLPSPFSFFVLLFCLLRPCSDCQAKLDFWIIQIIFRLILLSLNSKKNHIKFRFLQIISKPHGEVVWNVIPIRFPTDVSAVWMLWSFRLEIRESFASF